MNTHNGLLWSLAPQQSEEWLAVRRGRITGSRIKDALDFKAPTKKQQDAGIKRGEPGQKRLAYAMDTARERLGGRAAEVYVNAAMRLGTTEETPARVTYEDRTGNMVEQVGFAYTEDGKFGCSVDGLILRPRPSRLRRVWECKTMVSSDTLFGAVIDGDISAYRHQCLFNMWLLGAEAVELYLHVWDIPALSTIVVIERDENEIQALEDDLMEFERLVTEYETKLRAKLAKPAAPTQAAPDMDAPWELPTTDTAPAAKRALAAANF